MSQTWRAEDNNAQIEGGSYQLFADVGEEVATEEVSGILWGSIGHVRVFVLAENQREKK